MSFGGGKSKSQVQEAPPPPQVAPTPDKPTTESLRRAGRASLLISTSPQGVLGAATTGRRKLLSGGE